MTTITELKVKTNKIDLVPMSREQLRIENKHNYRKNYTEIWFIDGAGKQFCLMGREILAAGIDVLWGEALSRNLGIKEINIHRRILVSELKERCCIEKTF